MTSAGLACGKVHPENRNATLHPGPCQALLLGLVPAGPHSAGPSLKRGRLTVRWHPVRGDLWVVKGVMAGARQSVLEGLLFFHIWDTRLFVSTPASLLTQERRFHVTLSATHTMATVPADEPLVWSPHSVSSSRKMVLILVMDRWPILSTTMATPPSSPYAPPLFHNGWPLPQRRLRICSRALTCTSQATSAGLTSLRSSVLKFQEENGRTYHAMSSGSTSPSP